MAARMTIQVKRVYAPVSPSDGKRFLVDRLWPRGVRKDALALEAWSKDAAPSNALRERFHHDPQQWDDFKAAYFSELDANPTSWEPLLQASLLGKITLLYAARDETYNNAAALKEYLESR